MSRPRDRRDACMKPELLIVSPLFPPAPGGLADHTANLASHLAAHTRVSVLGSRDAGSAEGLEVHPDIADWSDGESLLEAFARRAPGAVILWQYVPHMYGRGGVNAALAKVMGTLRSQGRTQWIIAHEIAAPLTWVPHRLGYALAHRRQWKGILANADRIAFSTEAWFRKWSRHSPSLKSRFIVLPSPSAVPVAPATPLNLAEWRRARGIPEGALVLGYFGTLSAAKQFGWVVSAWRQAQWPHRVALVVIGAKPETRIGAGLDSLYLPLGFVSSREASIALQATDVLALPFIDGVSERRTTFMAGLSHGCAVVTTIGENTGPELRKAGFLRTTHSRHAAKFALAVRELMEDEAERNRLSHEARKAYAAAYDWPVVVKRLLGTS
jgi:glycosyltransferase involved in cell wall biosynthesis